MKIYFTLAVASILFIIGAASCKKTTIAPTTNSGMSSSSKINGEWSLVQVSGGIAGTNTTYQVGEIVWTIDSTNSTVVVINPYTTNNNYTRFDSGTYSFQSLNSAGGIRFLGNNDDLGAYTITGNVMLIDPSIGADGGVVNDGISYKFVR